jgi:hypothetical protein
MFSRKRLAYIIIITLIFSGLFFLFNLDHDFLRSQAINEGDEIAPLERASATLEGKADDGFLVVGNPQTEAGRLIKTNTLKTLSQTKASFRVVDTLGENDLMGDLVLIFVVSDITQVGELEDIAEYIREGGRAVFAAGIPSGSELSYLNPIWGILERGSFTTVSDLTFHEGFFPYDEITVLQAYASYSSTLRLEKACEVLISGENDIPLVWVHDYDLGRITMINGTFMESKLSSGILIASINASLEQSIYPILATKTVFLDAIPPLFDGNDDHSFEYYGRSAESFVRDKLWAVLLQKATLLDLKLSSSFMAIDKQSFVSQNANQQTFSYISREIIQTGGEITLSGNHVELDKLTEQRIQQTKVFFENFFPNYKLNAYYPLYGKMDQTQMEMILSVYPTIDIIRILYDGDGVTQSSGDFEVIDQKVYYPTTTYGFKAEGLQMYTFLSVLTSHGAISHSFDINSLFTVPSSESNWNTLNKTFDTLTDLYFKATPWLESKTLSLSAEKVKLLDALEVKTKTESNQITVACSDITMGQKFMFYSTKEIISISGASMTRINSRYYLIEAKAASFVIVY